MTRLTLIVLVTFFTIYSVSGQDCTTSTDCFSDSSACEDDLVAMYDTNNEMAVEYSECAENGVTCTEFSQMCGIDGDGNYNCVDVSQECADEVESCSCPTTPPSEDTTPADGTTLSDRTIPADETTAAVVTEGTTAAPATEGTTAALDTEGTTAGPATEGTTAGPDTEGTAATEFDATEATDGSTAAPGTDETEGTEGTAATAATSGDDRKPIPGGDFHRFCCRWAINGRCDKNPKFMRPLCQKSCGTKNCKAEDYMSCKVSVTATPENCDTYKPTTIAPVVPVVPVKPAIPYRRRQRQRHRKAKTT